MINNVVSLYEDKGCIWAATWSGLSKLNVKDNKFRNYFPKDSVYTNNSVSFIKKFISDKKPIAALLQYSS